MAGGFLMLALLFIAGLVIYFVPTIVAKNREHHNFTAIFMLNLLLGWTLLGWVAALVWAYTEPSAQRAPEPVPSWVQAASSPAAASTKPADEKLCPFCAETIKAAALVCKHCGRDLPAPEATAGPATALEERAKALGIVHSPSLQRYVWRRDFFTSLEDAVTFAERNS